MVINDKKQNLSAVCLDYEQCLQLNYIFNIYKLILLISDSDTYRA